MRERSKVELFEAIRRGNRLEGLSVRALARRHHVHRRTVREALANEVPQPRKRSARVATALTEAHRAAARGWLVEDLDAPRKQWHTARRVFVRLRDECGAQVAESTVRAFVAEVRAELWLCLGPVTQLQDVPDLERHGWRHRRPLREAVHHNRYEEIFRR